MFFFSLRRRADKAKMKYPKSLGQKRNASTSLMPLSIEVLGYPKLQKIKMHLRTQASAILFSS